MSKVFSIDGNRLFADPDSPGSSDRSVDAGQMANLWGAAERAMAAIPSGNQSPEAQNLRQDVVDLLNGFLDGQAYVTTRNKLVRLQRRAEDVFDHKRITVVSQEARTAFATVVLALLLLAAYWASFHAALIDRVSTTLTTAFGNAEMVLGVSAYALLGFSFTLFARAYVISNYASDKDLDIYLRRHASAFGSAFESLVVTVMIMTALFFGLRIDAMTWLEQSIFGHPSRGLIPGLVLGAVLHRLMALFASAGRS